MLQCIRRRHTYTVNLSPKDTEEDPVEVENNILLIFLVLVYELKHLETKQTVCVKCFILTE